MSLATLLNQTATIQRATYGTDSLAGRTETWTNVGTIRCRLRALSARERPMMGSDGTEITHRMYCSPTDITERDRVVIDGTVYEVAAVNRLPGGVAGHHYEVDLVEYRREV